ncbi:unnamed protein product [Dibothriocephalus latus]|uniref:Uncharacterized protein n=1 Tax=Dibothriocephalus latus TaxID=60516 RepID=A0A3P7LCX5_DIBLA|nr:unnamed protein product [Dibothriocephalus latus]
MSEQTKMNETQFLVWVNKSGPPISLNRTPKSDIEIACVSLEYQGSFPPPSLPTTGEVTLLFIGLLLGTLLIDRICQCVRRSHKCIQDDFVGKQNPDNLGLAVTYLVSQIAWPTIVLDSALSTIYNGIAATILDSVARAFAPAIFTIFLLEMRTKAPGAKSFPQFIRRRFGGVAHVLVLLLFIITSIANILKILA